MTAEKIFELAADGYGAAQIAKELNISRQRVYQIAGALEISFPHRNFAAPKPRPPKVITGGIPVSLNQTTTGTISEMLVCADLLSRGWKPYLPILRQKGHDIIACRSNEVITIEVRTAFRRDSGALSYNRRDMNSSHFGLVVTGEPVIYIPEI